GYLPRVLNRLFAIAPAIFKENVPKEQRPARGRGLYHRHLPGEQPPPPRLPRQRCRKGGPARSILSSRLRRLEERDVELVAAVGLDLEIARDDLRHRALQRADRLDL